MRPNFTAAMGKHPASIGAALAVISLPVHFLLSANISHQIAAVALALIAGVYVGFAVQDGRPRILVAEGLVALAFFAAALAGLIVSHWVIPLAYLMHGLWDLAHHRRVKTSMPAWDVPLCAVYDWVFAAGLTTAWILHG